MMRPSTIWLWTRATAGCGKSACSRSDLAPSLRLVSDLSPQYPRILRRKRQPSNKTRMRAYMNTSVKFCLPARIQ